MSDEDLTLARETLIREKAAFVVVGNGKILGVEKGQGVQPLWDFLTSHEAEAKDATLADKIVGRAVAFIAVKFGLRCVFGEILSDGARAVLEKHGVCWAAEKQVPLILNRAGDGPCPIEKGLRTISDTEQALQFLSENGFFRSP